MKTTFNIKGLHCTSCKMLIEDVCSEIKGITSSNVDVKKGTLVIEHDDKVDVKKLKKEIESLGEYMVDN